MVSDQEVEALLPCPLCSYPARATEPRRSTTAQMDAGYGEWNYGVECAADLACGCCVGEFPDQSEAISAWNRRQAAAAIPPSGEAATWVALDDEGHAELRVNGKRITSFPSYPAAEEAASRINQALYAAPPAPVAIDEAMVERLQKLAREYRPTMNADIVHHWGAEVAALLAALNPQPSGGA